MMKNIKRYIVLATLITGIVSCQKYLDIKPSSNIVLPETLTDMEQLLDNGSVFANYPEFLELQTDDYYFEEDFWNSLINQVDKNVHVWDKDIYGTTESHSSWSSQYSKIFYANAVLEGLANIERNEFNEARYDQAKGSALFLKAEAVYLLTQLFCKVYDKASADKDLGIPVPMSADINEKVSRPSLAANFEFIINSIVEAEKLLSSTVDFSRPSKGAAHALLARVNLYMGEYDEALNHSDKALSIYSHLSDLNLGRIRTDKDTYFSSLISPSSYIRSRGLSTLIDTILYDSFNDNDLRKQLFFTNNTSGQPVRERSYVLLSVNLSYSGLDTDEQFLIRAECYARAGNTTLALQDLNHLLKHRYKTGSFTVLASTNATEVLNWVLQERRKELIFRGLRWSDLKRFNRDGANITLKRQLGIQAFNLPPNDARWVLPIPINEIKISGIQQNDR